MEITDEHNAEVLKHSIVGKFGRFHSEGSGG